MKKKHLPKRFDEVGKQFFVDRKKLDPKRNLRGAFAKGSRNARKVVIKVGEEGGRKFRMGEFRSESDGTVMARQ